MKALHTILIGTVILAAAAMCSAFAEDEAAGPPAALDGVDAAATAVDAAALAVDAAALAKVSFVKDGQLDIDAAVKYFEDLYRSDSSISTAEMTVVRPRRTRTLLALRKRSSVAAGPSGPAGPVAPRAPRGPSGPRSP